jgi:hypothetical protein
MSGTSVEPPLRAAAHYLATKTRSVTCSIYALAAPPSADASTDDRLFYVAGTFGCDGHTPGPSAEFSIKEGHYRQIETTGRWTGFTSFVALSGISVSVASVESPRTFDYGGVSVTVDRDLAFSELKNPGPFLCVPVKAAHIVVGVVRVQRRADEEPFDTATQRDLELLAPLLAMSMTLEQARTRVLRVVGELSEKNGEDALLEAVAEQARDLVQAEHHAASVFLEDPSLGLTAKGVRRGRPGSHGNRDPRNRAHIVAELAAGPREGGASRADKARAAERRDHGRQHELVAGGADPRRGTRYGDRHHPHSVQ